LFFGSEQRNSYQNFSQVSAGVGVKTGFDVAGGILAFGMAIFAAF
jgi:hypothetical protein